MKFLTVLLFTATVFSSFNCTSKGKGDTVSGLNLKAVLKGTYMLSESNDFSYYLVDVRLNNNSDSTCKFVVSSCETNLNLLTDSEQAVICRNECGGNFPRLITLKVNQTFSIPVIIKVNKNSDAFGNPLKIGMLLFNSMNLRELYDILQKKDKYENVIWSDSFILNDAGPQAYDIY